MLLVILLPLKLCPVVQFISRSIHHFPSHQSTMQLIHCSNALFGFSYMSHRQGNWGKKLKNVLHENHLLIATISPILNANEETQWVSNCHFLFSPREHPRADFCLVQAGVGHPGTTKPPSVQDTSREADTRASQGLRGRHGTVPVTSQRRVSPAICSYEKVTVLIEESSGF